MKVFSSTVLDEDDVIANADDCEIIKNIENNTITVTYKTFPEVAGTRYVTIENKDTGRMPFLYNDIQYTDEITLQAANTNNMTNGYIWKVTSDGEGNITVLNAENGKGIKPSAGNHCSSNITAFQVTAGANAGYYNLINSTAITNGHDRLNAANSTSDYHNEANLRAVTTWTGTHNDNDWKFNSLYTEGLTEYTVTVTQPTGCKGYALYDGKKAANGGFFLAPANLQQTAVSAGEVSGYTYNVTINGNTIKVEYTASTVDYTVNITGATDATVTFEGTPHANGETITATGLTPSQLTASYAEGYYAPEISIEGNVITVAYTALPFQVGDHYYTMKSNSNNYVFDGTNAWYNNSVDVKGKNHLWQFEHVDGTLDLYMLKTCSGKYGVLSGSGRNALAFADEPTVWDSGTGETSYFRVVAQNGGFDLQHPGDARTNVGSHVDGKLGSWAADGSPTNGASINKVEEVVAKNYTVTITGAPEGETPAITYEGNTYETGSTIEDALGIVDADLTVPEYESHVYTLDITGAAITVTYKNYLIELQNKIEALLGPDSKIGKVGYPQSTSTEYAAAIGYSQNFGDGVTNDNYFDAYDAYEALMAVEDVVKPEAGHAYKLSLRSLDGTKHWYLTNDGGVSESESDAAIFVMGASEDEDFGAIFVTNNNGDIKYLKSNGTSTDTYAESYCDFQIAPMVNVSNSYISADNEARFGTFYLKAMRRHDKGSSDNTHGAMILKEENQKWDISGDPYMNGNFSSAIEMEEVEYPYTKPTLVKNEGDAGSFASIWLPFPMLFQEGVEVYKGTTERSADGNSYLGLKRVDTDCVVAAGGYILYSETLTGQIDIQPVAGTPEDQHEDDDAAFVGSTKPDYTMSDLKADHSGTPYVLANKSKGIGFYKYTGTTLPKGKAIWMKEDGSAETVKFSFDDIISAIEALHGNTTNAAIYDLQGHRLDKVQKGQINVINGQKIMFK